MGRIRTRGLVGGGMSLAVGFKVKHTHTCPVRPPSLSVSLSSSGIADSVYPLVHTS